MKESTLISLDKTKIFISSLTDELTKDFKEIVAGDWGMYEPTDLQNVFLIDLEIFPDGYGLAAYPSDINLTQLGYKSLLKKYPDGPLREFTEGLDIDSIDFKNEDDSKEFDEYFNILTDSYISWISKCWDDAGGQNFSKPIYVMMHDGDDSFDLISKKWVSSENKWPEV